MAETMNVYKKLQKARVALQNFELSKSGWNDYGKYKYLELGDFLPAIVPIFDNLGLCSIFRIEEPYSEYHEGVEIKCPALAKLMIIDTDQPGEMITFSSEIAEGGIKGASPIQQLGGVHTYMRRYLWMEALELAIADEIEAPAKDVPKNKSNAQKAQKRATKEQLAEIAELFKGKDDRFKSMLAVYKVASAEELTQTHADAVIRKMKGELNDTAGH